MDSFLLVKLVFSGLLLMLLNAAEVSAQQTSASTNVDLAVTNYISLYNALYQAAFPLQSQTLGSNAYVTERFVMQVPGVVLNPHDYDPGELYRTAKADPNDGNPETNIHPRIAENMFRLTDPLPNSNPLTGGLSDRSLADTYRKIISSMDVKKFDELADSVLAKYQDAMRILQAPRKDPDSNYTQNVTLLDLYNRYKERYYMTSQEVEALIETQQRSLTSIEYEKWFIRNYPYLRAKVESEYTRWILYGEKEVVDTYKVHLDVATEGEELEEARKVLRSTGVSALDRSGTIYPVTFSPSNWYQYLIPR